MYVIKYGDEGNNIDVTHVVYNKFIKQNIIYIPDGDANRAFYFTDPVPYVLKSGLPPFLTILKSVINSLKSTSFSAL